MLWVNCFWYCLSMFFFSNFLFLSFAGKSSSASSGSKSLVWTIFLILNEVARSLLVTSLLFISKGSGDRLSATSLAFFRFILRLWYLVYVFTFTPVFSVFVVTRNVAVILSLSALSKNLTNFPGMVELDPCDNVDKEYEEVQFFTVQCHWEWLLVI